MNECAKVKVGVFEDNKEIREQTIIFLEAAGYDVTAEAKSLPEALSVLRDAYMGKIILDAVFVDANLCVSRTCGTDGKTITDEIAVRNLNTKTIGFSGRKMSEYSDYGHDIQVDYDLGKDTFNAAMAVAEVLRNVAY